MTKEKNSGSEKILIKKYANRRLYHTQRSEYITLDDLSQMVRDGEDFIVQDAKSGEDLTRSVLTQIIFDAENNGHMLLPTSFLREIIRLYGDTMQGLVPSYLEVAMNNFMAHQETFHENLARNPAIAGLEQIQRMNQDWMQNSMKMFGAMNPIAASSRTEHKTEKDSSYHSELDDLKSQLKEMQDKLSKLVD